MYNIGDLIFYGKTGVCKIEEITSMGSSASEGEKVYYILRPLYQECKISIPVDNDRIYMRPIATRDEVIEMIDRIPQIEAKAFYCQNLNQLKEHYRSIMETHDCLAMIELIMSVYCKRVEVLKLKKKLGAVDERFMKEAEELIYGEFSAALGIEKVDVPAFIKQRIGNII